MNFDDSEKNYVEATLELLHFVEWDRFTFYEKETELTVFGWIGRKQDSYKDFVVLKLDLARLNPITFTTSSKTHSKIIAHLLDFDHTDCQRVESAFKVKNMVKVTEKIISYRRQGEKQA